MSAVEVNIEMETTGILNLKGINNFKLKKTHTERSSSPRHRYVKQEVKQYRYLQEF